ncbi:MAG TPA: glycosyltransferase [Chitinophagaceae bacterium]|nr:glycosyltransferase [Chitinophagaceae bacterium]
MNQKKILIITHGFYPQQSPRSFRATELAKEFCRQNHEVTVMAPYRKGIEAILKEYPIIFKSLGSLNLRIFNFQGLGIVGRLYNKAVNRLLPLLFEYPMMELFFKVRKLLKSETTRYDILISIAVPYPIHWGVASVWNKKNKIINIAALWVADCGDPYSLRENDTFRPPFYFRWVEKWFMRKVDYVSVPTVNSFKGYFPEFHHKLRVISQGFRFEDITCKPTITDGIVRFGYGGSFIPGWRDPRELLDFLCSLPPDWKFEFHVFTSQEHFIKPYAKYDNRIILHSLVSRNILLETLSSYQFVVNFANKGTAETPSKIIDYAIINKPVLNIDTGSLDKELVLSFLKGDYSRQLRIENIYQYRIENVTARFLSLLGN